MALFFFSLLFLSLGLSEFGCRLSLSLIGAKIPNKFETAFTIQFNSIQALLNYFEMLFLYLLTGYLQRQSDLNEIWR